MSSILTSVVSCTITSSGISAPTYDEIRSALVTMFQSIYGNDIVLDNSTQDGQLIGIFSEAIDQVNSACVQVYNSFSPTYAQGNSLSSVVKINGITRKASSYSTVDLLLTGTAGTTLNNCTAQDVNGYTWTIPTGTVISSDGSVTATATCTTIGPVTAYADTVTTIGTPVLGWSGVTNTTAAASGAPVETDATLRLRQVSSTMLPSQTVLDGLIGAVAAIDGVQSVSGFENDTDYATVDGLAAHTVAIVVDGGDATAIATAIANKKSLGCATQGNTTETVTDSAGRVQTINFYRPTFVPIVVNINIDALTGYTDAIGSSMSSAISTYIGGQSPGGTIYLNRLYGPANLDSSSGGTTYNINSITAGRDGTTPATGNIVLAFYETPVCPPSNVNIIIGEEALW